MSRTLAFLLAACCAAALAAEKKPVTPEAISSFRGAPAPGDPIWSPDGKRFVYTEAGKLRLYDVAARSSRELTALKSMSAAATAVPSVREFAFENRGVREAGIQWLPNGRELLISEGADLFLFRIEAGGWTQLTATPEAERDPKVSPDGLRVAFRRAHDLYTLEIASRKVTRLTDTGSATLLNGELDWVYPEELDLGTAYWWSPDSQSIAYMQFDISREPFYPQVDLTRIPAVLEPQRFPKAGDPNADVQLGVVPATGGRTTWMNTGVVRDTLMARVAWLPDSSALAVTKLNRVQDHLELLVADAKTGASHTVLREEDPQWVNVREEIRFLANGREFLWASERDGFQHLYRYSIEGKQLAQLTSGDWEVSDVACVDEKAGRVFYVSAEAGPLERQFYSIGLDGSGKRKLSSEVGTHSISMSPDCGTYLDRFSSLKTPPRRTLHASDGKELAVYTEADRKATDEYTMLPSEIVEVKAADGAVLYGRLIRPAGYQAGKRYPVIVDVYGGPHAQSVQNRWPGVMTSEQMFAQRGFVVWSLDGRGTFGRGHKWEAAVYRNLGPRELEDQIAGVKYLVDSGIADPKRIGVTGWSYGGFMTLNSMLNGAGVFAAGLAGAPVTDWRNYDSIYTERYMGLPAENSKGYDATSLVSAAAKLKGKLLIVHNIEDDNVLFQNSIRMADALENANKPFDMLVYPNKSHGLSRGRDHFSRTMLEFFEKTLK